MSKTIFITGASSGIGYEVSKEFSRKGWNVIAAARRVSKLKKLSKFSRIRNSYGKIIPLKLDITDFLLTKKNILNLIKDHGIPDIIFLNAGTNHPNKKNIFSLNETKSIFKINFFGTINCIEAFLPHIKKGKKKVQLIIMASVAGYRGLPYAAPYCSSKAALISFTEAIFNQCNENGITLRLVNPGFIKTPLTDKNNFAMPFIISSEKAAKILYKKFIFSNSFEINLPSFFCYLMKILRILPNSIYLKLTKLLIKKL